MNLSEMLREQDPVCDRRSVTPEEWQTHGKWTQYGIGAELAALVGAAEALYAAMPNASCDAECACRMCSSVDCYDAARAALVAKIEGRS